MNRLLSALRGTLAECWRAGRLSRDEYERRVEGLAVRGSRTTPGRALTKDEIECLTRELDVRDRAIILVMVSGGLRRAEIAALRYQDVTIEADEIELVVTGKGDKERRVYLTGAAAQALSLHLAEHPGADGAIGWAGNQDRVFNLSTSGLAKRLARVLQRISATSHDLRRTYASVALDRGVDLATVQKVMGHADPRTTAGYDRRSVESEKKAARLVDDWMKGVE